MNGRTEKKPGGTYLAVALVACSALAIEIIVSRIFSVITYYYMAFAAISVAMLGMTAGAVTVFLKKEWFGPSCRYTSLARLSMAYWLSVIAIALAFCTIPIAFDNIFHRIISLGAMIFLSSLPFYFAGIIITASLTVLSLPSGKVYASDLTGAALGCLLVLVGFNFYDAFSLLILCSLAGLLASVFFARDKTVTKVITLSLLLIATVSVGLLNSFSGNILRPPVVKGKKEKSTDFVYERWNSYSRVSVKAATMEPPQYWGASPLAPRNKLILQYNMSIDGDAGTVLRSFNDSGDLQHLNFDIVNFAYFLRPSGAACIIGAGGAKDIQAAIYFGHAPVTGIDLNPVFIDLLNNKFRKVANVADHPGVTLVNDEARSYLSRSSEKYDVIQMSLVDTWASVGAGAFSLSENNLYTVEAWKVFLSHLSDSGVFTVSRWYNPRNLGETGRLVSLAMESLRSAGKQHPLDHIALLTVNNLSTLIVSSCAFTNASILLLEKKASQLQYNVVIKPGTLPLDAKLRAITSAASSKELTRALSGEELNYVAPTDESPYFFNMLKFGHLRYGNDWKIAGIMTGNLQATISLFILTAFLLLFALLICIVPLMFKAGGTIQRGSRSAACYFSFVGMAFMFTEIAMLQRVSVFLGHPAYALGVLLFTIIASTGVGSFVNARLKTIPVGRAYALSVATALCIIAENLLFKLIIGHFITAGTPLKFILSVLVIFPLGILLGQFFPGGLRMVNNAHKAHVAWFCALNGVFGVLVSAIAILISVYGGISYNFYLASLFYLLPVFFIKRMTRE